MIVLYVILSLLALTAVLVAFVLTQKIKVHITYGNDLKIVARLLFIKYTLYPSKEKKRKAKPAKKKSKRKKKAQQPQESEKSKNKQATKKKGVYETISFVGTLIGELLSRFKKAMSVDINKLRVVVGGAEDAARAAVEYGAVCAAAQSLLAYTDNYPDKVHVGDDFSVDIDYLATKYSMELDVVINFRVHKTLSALLHTAIRYLTSK